MAGSEEERYNAFVTRTLNEVQVGLVLDNGQEGSRKKRVFNALERRTKSDDTSNRNAAQKVIDGRFILGGDDASYLASGLAVLWSTVGTPVTSKGGQELSLAPAALYSPDAVNGIHRGMIAAMEKRNRDMRKGAPSALSNLMKALLPLLPFLGMDDEEEFLKTGKVSNVDERNHLFRILVEAKKKLDTEKAEGKTVPSSSLAFKILQQATEGHKAALRAQREASEKELLEVKRKSRVTIVALTKQLDLLREKLTRVEEECEKARNSKQRAFAEAESQRQQLLDAVGKIAKERDAEAGLRKELNEQVEELTSKIAESESQKQQLLDALGKIAKERDAEAVLRKELNEKVEELIAKTAEAESQKQALVDAAGKLAKERDSEAAQRKEANEKVEQKSQEIKALNLKITGLKNDIAAKEKAQAKRKSEYQDLLTQRNAANEEVKGLRKEIANLNATAAQKDAELAQRQTKLEECEGKIKTLQDAQERYEKEQVVLVQRLEAQIAALEEREAQAQAQKEKAEAAYAAILNKQNLWTEQTQQQLDDQKARLNNEHGDELAAKAEQWQKELAEAEDAAAKKAKAKAEDAATESVLRAENDAAAKVVEALGIQEQAEDRIKQLKSELDDAKVAQNNDVNVLQTKLAEAVKANATLQEQLEASKAARAACDAAATEVEAKLAKCEEAKSKTEEKAKAAAAKLDDCEEALKEKQAEVATLTKKLQVADTDAAAQAELQAQLDQAKAEVEECEEELENVQSKLDECNASVDEQNKELLRLAVERKTCQEALNEQEQTNEALLQQLVKQNEDLRTTTNEQEALLKNWADRKDQMEKEERSKYETAVKNAESQLKDIQANLQALALKRELLDWMEVTRELENADKNIAGQGDMSEENRQTLEKEKAKLEPEALKQRDAMTVLEQAIEGAQKELQEKKKALEEHKNTVPDTPYAPMQGTQASSGDAWIDAAIFRGLVGQRGPTEAADVAHCPQDALLPYALPNVKQVVKHLLPAHLLLQSTPDPTAADLERAMGAWAACEHADKRQRLSPDAASAATTSEALALFEDDFAITGEVPTAELPAERCGVELPHEVRWMPQGPRARTMARVAVMEHAVARCAQLAASADVDPNVATALRHAGAALKLQQLAPLYELCAAAENEDEPHPLGTNGRRLVTRPCAVVRGTLSFPMDAGVAPLTKAHVANVSKPLTQDASLAQAMGKTAMDTAALRNDLRKRGLAHNVYVAPAAHALAFRSAPTGVGFSESGPSPGPPSVTSDRASAALYRDETFVRIINRLIVAAAALELDGGDSEAPDPVAAFLEASNPAKDGEGLVTPQTRREGLWAEMHRHVAISQDRLWIFVRLMSGKIGGNVSEVITLADEATLKAAKAIQEQRLEVSKRVSDMQAKIVETVVASMLKNSRMTMEYVEKGDDKNLAVIDAEARKNLKDLETGASGRPFFEANVALKNLTQPNQAPPKLQDVLSGLADVGAQMQSTLEQTLAEPGAASASLIELSHPSNSYFVSMRADAIAAIREAQEKLNCEMGVLGITRRMMLWELVEGGCSVLVQRFAELCGYLLVQARTSTGVSAMYVSHQNIYTNASQARISLAKLTAAACEYVARVPAPKFEDVNPKTARFEALTQGEKVREIDITARRVPMPVAALRAPISASGWVNEGGRRHT